MFDFKDQRYNRQENMPEWGVSGQRLMSEATVAVIGAGGVKSSLLINLVSAGVGNITIIEFDHVELSNLNRQFLYKTSDIGKSKGDCAKKSLTSLNPEINIQLIHEKIDGDNIEKILNTSNIIVEGGDSPFGRNLVNEYCLSKNKPMIHCSAQFSYGYVFTLLPEKKSACFACAFPDDYTRMEHTGPVPVNVLSTSIAGSLGAAEVIKVILGRKESLYINEKRFFDSLVINKRFGVEKIARRQDCPVCRKYYTHHE